MTKLCKYNWYCNEESDENVDFKQDYICECCLKKVKNAELNIINDNLYFYSNNVEKIESYNLLLSNLNIVLYYVKNDFIFFKTGNILFFNKENYYLGFLDNFNCLSTEINLILKELKILRIFKELKEKNIFDKKKSIELLYKNIKDFDLLLSEKENENKNILNKLKSLKKNNIFYIFNKKYYDLKFDFKNNLNYLDYLYSEYKDLRDNLFDKEILLKKEIELYESFSIFSYNLNKTDYFNFFSNVDLSNYFEKSILNKLIK